MEHSITAPRTIGSVAGFSFAVSLFLGYPHEGALQRFSAALLIYAVARMISRAHSPGCEALKTWISRLLAALVLLASTGLVWIYTVGLTVNTHPASPLQPILAVASAAIGALVLRDIWTRRSD